MRGLGFASFLALIGIVAACSKAPTNLILGAWQEQSGKEVLEFFKDGTLSVNNGAIVGEYIFLDAHRIKLTLPGWGVLAGPQIFTVDVTKNMLVLTDPGGKVSGYSRKPAAEANDLAGVEIAWVTIPGGNFARGNDKYFKPRQSVTVRTFQMAKTSVTFAQYKRCVAAGACTPAHVSDGKCSFWDGARWNNNVNLPASFQAGDQPVVCVDWDQAKQFSEWVGGRLPSEAEWEYAALSAGKEWKHPWGNEDATCERAVMIDAGYGCGKGSAWPVCSKPKGNTEQGLCDMNGNVEEWTQDWYHASYDGAPADGSPWGVAKSVQDWNYRERHRDRNTPNPWPGKPGDFIADLRIIRGGSWNSLETNNGQSARLKVPLDNALMYYNAQQRSAHFAGYIGGDIGFRPARDPFLQRWLRLVRRTLWLSRSVSE